MPQLLLDMKNIISVNQITKKYPVPIKQSFLRTIFWPQYTTVTAVSDISFQINYGESIGLLGPNGAGKTTTLKMLSGLLEPTHGEIRVLGYQPHHRKREFLKQIAMVLGNKNSLSWELSGIQNFAILKTIYKLDQKDLDNQINELSELLDVTSSLNTPIRKLSLGQRLKMELIASILHHPKLLFLDEPTLGLDIIAKRKIRGFIRNRNQQEGSTIILTSHDMADVEKVVDRIMVINSGKLIFDGSMSNLLSQYKTKKYLIVHLEE